MGGFEAVALRGICAAYAEREVLPLLREVQQAQGQIVEQLKLLGARVDGACAALNTQELEDKLNKKADAEKVPSFAQFEELVAKVQHVGQNSQACELDARMAPILERLEALERAVESTPSNEDYATAEQLEELSVLVHQKANASSSQLKRLSETVDRKAFTSKVPSIAAFQELQEAVALKVDARLVPTIAQVEELSAEVKRKKVSNLAMEEVKKVSAELDRKANCADVIKAPDVEKLVQQKLDSLVTKKADAGDVPTLAQHKELAAATERKLAFLASKVQQKTDALRDMQQQQQQQQTVWCVHPAVVDVAWDENGNGQATWPEWNPSRMMPTSGCNENGGSPQNIFVPSAAVPVNNNGFGNCSGTGTAAPGGNQNGKPEKPGRRSSKGPNSARRSGSSGTSSTATAPTPPSQDM